MINTFPSGHGSLTGVSSLHPPKGTLQWAVIAMPDISVGPHLQSIVFPLMPAFPGMSHCNLQPIRPLLCPARGAITPLQGFVQTCHPRPVCLENSGSSYDPSGENGFHLLPVRGDGECLSKTIMVALQRGDCPWCVKWPQPLRGHMETPCLKALVPQDQPL